jgi:RNA polymerase sigma-70 factor (TIGR02952 family)
VQQIALIDDLDKKETKDVLYEVEKDFTYIFKTYYKRIYNYIYYRVNCHYTAEDLTSRVFEKVMLKIDTYSESKSPFEVWLFSIARNLIRDYFRSFKKYKFLSIDTIKELVSKKKTPEDIVEISETNDELLKALNILDTRERNIIALKFGAELKNKEIAEILDLTESNVGVILYRTMKKLKKELERGDKYE